MPSVERSTYHYPVDALRFAAALAVAWFHLSFYSWANPASSTGQALGGVIDFPWATPWAWFGWVGVEVFFVISGFVIANSARGASATRFLKGRLLRLMPAAWICATITLVVRLVLSSDPARALLSPYLHSMVLWPEPMWIDGVYWSLAVEVAFYALIFALLLMHGFRFLPVVAWGLTLASGIYLTILAGNLVPPSPIWQAIVANSEILLLRHGVYFAVGIWLWLSNQRRLSPVGWAGLTLGLGLGCLEIWLRAHSLKVGEATAALGQPSVLPMAIWLVAVTGMLVVTRWPERIVWSPAMGARVKRLGRMTYPLYLVHNIVGVSLIRVLVTRGVPGELALAGGLATVLGLSFVVSQFGEPVVVRGFRAVLDRGEQALEAFTTKRSGLRPH
jgi:peptidoglycan/LPS O-acetylase OafA/YrhL